MSHAKQGAGSIYFATLQGYVINETNLYDTTLSFLGLLVVETRDICDLNGIALHYSVSFSLI